MRWSSSKEYRQGTVLVPAHPTPVKALPFSTGTPTRRHDRAAADNPHDLCDLYVNMPPRIEAGHQQQATNKAAATADAVGPDSANQQSSAEHPRPLLWRHCNLSVREDDSQPAAGWQAAYWKEYNLGIRGYDVASCCLKVFLLLGNVRRSVSHGELRAAVCATGATLLVAATVAVMLLYQAQYGRHRRLVMWSNLAAISIMMATSMPQFLSASSSRLWAHKALVLLFKMGVTWPMMAAIMHRLPWQDLALLCSTFCLWLCYTWAQPLCSHIHRSDEDAAFIRSLASMLDAVTGLGTDSGHGSPAGGIGTSSSGGAAAAAQLLGANSSSMLWPPGSSAAELGSAAAAAGVAAVGGGGEDVYWSPLADHLAAACLYGPPSASSSGSSLSPMDCQALLMGQCTAVVTTLTLWVGVLVILFCVVLSEQHSKWRWWHSSGARPQGRPPQVYAPTSALTFLGCRLLYLHILLDVPLMLLWVATSSWYRQPTAAPGVKLNLW